MPMPPDDDPNTNEIETDNPDERPATSAKQDRGRKFHEATGSLRDLGIAILLLVLLYVIVYFTFLR